MKPLLPWPVGPLVLGVTALSALLPNLPLWALVCVVLSVVTLTIEAALYERKFK
jgi:hypothetical protein